MHLYNETIARHNVLNRKSNVVVEEIARSLNESVTLTYLHHRSIFKKINVHFAAYLVGMYQKNGLLGIAYCWLTKKRGHIPG